MHSKNEVCGLFNMLENKYKGTYVTRCKMTQIIKEEVSKSVDRIFLNKVINNYLANTCNTDNSSKNIDARNALILACYNFIIEESYDYRDYSFFLSRLYNTYLRLKRAFIKYICENQKAVNDEFLAKYNNIDVLINYVKKHNYKFDYYIKEYIKEEYINDLIWNMLQGADFFTNIKYDSQGRVYANRMISIPKDRCEDYFEFYNHLGKYWSYTKGFSYDNFFGEDFQNGNIYQITFYAVVPAESISMNEMMKANFGNFDEEDEITLICGKPVEIYKVIVTDLSNNETWKVPLKRHYICEV